MLKQNLIYFLSFQCCNIFCCSTFKDVNPTWVKRNEQAFWNNDYIHCALYLLVVCGNIKLGMCVAVTFTFFEFNDYELYKTNPSPLIAR